MENLAMRRGTRIVALAAGAAAAATMACTLACPANALAADGVAYSVDDQGNKTYYSTIDDAMSAGYSLKDNTIVMNEDWNVSKTLYVADSKKLVIDMNGHSIHSTDSDYVFRLYEHSTLELTSSKWNSFDYRGYTKDSWTGNWDWKTLCVGSGGLVCDDNGGQGLHMDSYSTLKLDNVAVAGNRDGGVRASTHCTINMTNKSTIVANHSSDGGAGVRLNDYGTLTMDNSRIDSNCSGSFGGGVWVDSNCRIYMKNESAIKNNDAQGGGGVCFSSSYNYLISEDRTALISRNTALNSRNDNDKSGGGGILVRKQGYRSNYGEIIGITVTDNHSNRNAGGISLLQEYVHVNECTIIDNDAKYDGGGILVDNDDDYILNCTIKGNVCGYKNEKEHEGGGVYVDYDCDVALEGVCLIKGNKRGGKNGSADDVFLSDFGLSHAYITGGVKEGSKIGVRTGMTSSNQKIGKELSSNCYGAFFMDLSGYYVKYEFDHRGDMWQIKGNQAFATFINGKETNRYNEGVNVAINGTTNDARKIFWYWDASASEGMYPVSDYINDTNKLNPILSFSMPQNDVRLKAVYADRIKVLKAIFDKPEAGKSLPTAARISRADGGEGWSEGYVGITWYEETADGKKVQATGIAKPGTSYSAEIVVTEDTKAGRAFYAGIKAGNVYIEHNFWASDEMKVTSVEIDSATGALTVETSACKTEGEAPAEENVGTVTVNEVNGGLEALTGGSKQAQDADSDVIGTVDFSYSEGSESVTITAPKVDGFNFAYWDGVEDGWASDDVEGTVTIPAEELTDGLKITAVYTPVVTSIEVNISAPKAGKKLATSVNSLTAKTSDGKSVDLVSTFGKESQPVSWSTDGERAAYSSSYSAIIELDADGEGYEGVENVLSANAKVTFAGGEEAASAGFSVLNDKLCLCIIAPQTADVAKVKGLSAKKAGKKIVMVTWKKGDRDGVQIRYSLKKSMKGAKKVVVKGKAVKAKKIKKLKSGKKYYIQVRAYKTVNGKKCYSAWSAKTNVKVK